MNGVTFERTRPFNRHLTERCLSQRHGYSRHVYKAIHVLTLLIGLVRAININI